MNTQVPPAVKKAAGGATDIYGGTLTKVGIHQGKEVYTYVYSEPVTIGMPELYLWDGESVEVIDGEEALIILNADYVADNAD